VEQQLVDEGVLSTQDQRHEALLVEGHLGEGVQLSEDLKAHEMGFTMERSESLMVRMSLAVELEAGGAPSSRHI
jgi:hypothetical protein